MRGEACYSRDPLSVGLYGITSRFLYLVHGLVCQANKIKLCLSIVGKGRNAEACGDSDPLPFAGNELVSYYLLT